MCANFPRISIIVGDQEKPNQYLHAFYEAAGAKAVYVAEDTGVGVARHAAIAEVETEYILFCDDDFIFSNETILEAPLLMGSPGAGLPRWLTQKPEPRQ